MAVELEDGIYAVAPDGSCLEVYQVSRGHAVFVGSEAELGTFIAANDWRGEVIAAAMKEDGCEALDGAEFDLALSLLAPGCNPECIQIGRITS